ncbi:MAG: vWA domain-containing protein [Thermodesulfobacteriota bacterium]
MTNKERFELQQFLDHISQDRGPLVIKRDGRPPVFQDEGFHRETYRQDPELYALAALHLNADSWPSARLLFTLLRESRTGLDTSVKQTLDRIVVFLLATLPPDHVLKVFLGLKRVRANHKHTARAMRQYILNHPRLADMARRRRPALLDCLEHALGKNTARSCGRLLGEKNEAAAGFLHKNLLKHADNPGRVRDAMRFLYRLGPAPPKKGGQYRLLHQELAPRRPDPPRYPKTINVTNRGDIAATLVHIYRGGDNPMLREALNKYVDEAARPLPRTDIRLAVVLDASASTRGYGEREYACISQSVALRLVLEKCVAELAMVLVGGQGDPPRPQGETDLARGLLEALESRPDLILVLSDGYENLHQGDLGRVIAGLADLGVDTPIVFGHSQFTDKDDLALRRPVEGVPQFSFWHQNDFESVLSFIFVNSKGRLGQEFARRRFLVKLEAWEKEVRPWLKLN